MRPTTRRRALAWRVVWRHLQRRFRRCTARRTIGGCARSRRRHFSWQASLSLARVPRGCNADTRNTRGTPRNGRSVDPAADSARRADAFLEAAPRASNSRGAGCVLHESRAASTTGVVLVLAQRMVLASPEASVRAVPKRELRRHTRGAVGRTLRRNPERRHVAVVS